jgi:hypothetical protein
MKVVKRNESDSWKGHAKSDAAEVARVKQP